MKDSRRRQMWAWLFLGPALIFFIVFFAVPMLLALLLAFKNYNPAQGFWGSPWVGLGNFRDIFGNVLMRERVFRAFKNTLLFTVIFVPVNIMASMIIATLIHSVSDRAKNFYRAAFFLPTVTSAIIFAMIWRWLYDYNYGLINWVLNGLGMEGVNWLGDPRFSMWAVILAAVAAGPGANVLIYLAGLSRVPPQCTEAALVDGANPIQRWWHVTMPLLRPITLYLVVLNTIGSFQVFELVFMLTSGGPAGSSTVIVYEIYNLAFASGYYGQAGALSLILLLIVSGFAILQFKVFRTDVEATRPPTLIERGMDRISEGIEFIASLLWRLIRLPWDLFLKLIKAEKDAARFMNSVRMQRITNSLARQSAHLVLAPLSLLLLVPMIWMFLSAMTPGDLLQGSPLNVRPSNFAMDNYENLLEKTMFPREQKDDEEVYGWAGEPEAEPQPAAAEPREEPIADGFGDFIKRSKLVRWFSNTVYLAVLITALQSLLANLAAYPLAKIRFRGRKLIFIVFIASIMVPYQALFIPLFIVITSGIPKLTGIQIINSHWALILPMMCSPVAIFLMRQYIQTLPKSLEEAARIDGCGEFGIWRRVVLPLSKPILAAWGILSFTAIWKSFFWPFVVIGHEPYFPLEVGLQTIQQQHAVEYGLVMAGATVSAVPMILMFLIFQKQIVKGLTIGAVKG